MIAKIKKKEEAYLHFKNSMNIHINLPYFFFACLKQKTYKLPDDKYLAKTKLFLSYFDIFT